MQWHVQQVFVYLGAFAYFVRADGRLLDGAERIRAIGIVPVGSLFGEEVDG